MRQVFINISDDIQYTGNNTTICGRITDLSTDSTGFFDAASVQVLSNALTDALRQGDEETMVFLLADDPEFRDSHDRIDAFSAYLREYFAAWEIPLCEIHLIVIVSHGESVEISNRTVGGLKYVCRPRIDTVGLAGGQVYVQEGVNKTLILGNCKDTDIIKSAILHYAQYMSVRSTSAAVQVYSEIPNIPDSPCNEIYMIQPYARFYRNEADIYKLCQCICKRELTESMLRGANAEASNISSAFDAYVAECTGKLEADCTNRFVSIMPVRNTSIRKGTTYGEAVDILFEKKGKTGKETLLNIITNSYKDSNSSMSDGEFERLARETLLMWLCGGYNLTAMINEWDSLSQRGVGASVMDSYSDIENTVMPCGMIALGRIAYEKAIFNIVDNYIPSIMESAKRRIARAIETTMHSIIQRKTDYVKNFFAVRLDEFDDASFAKSAYERYFRFYINSNADYLRRQVADSMRYNSQITFDERLDAVSESITERVIAEYGITNAMNELNFQAYVQNDRTADIVGRMCTYMLQHNRIARLACGKSAEKVEQVMYIQLNNTLVRGLAVSDEGGVLRYRVGDGLSLVHTDGEIEMLELQTYQINDGMRVSCFGE